MDLCIDMVNRNYKTSTQIDCFNKIATILDIINKIDDIGERNEAAKLHLSQYHSDIYNLVSYDIATLVKGVE